MKKHIKILILFTIILVLIGVTLTLRDIYKVCSSNDTKEITNENLGLLKYKIKNNEKDEIEKLMGIKNYLTQNRLSKNTLEPSLIESKISRYIDEKLNEYTIKYLLNGYEFEDIGDESELNKNSTLIKLKNMLNKDDYNKLEELIKDYKEGYYISIDDIYILLQKYKCKHADTIAMYLTESSNLNLEAFFTIDKNLDINYKNINYVTSKKLSKSELKNYKNIWNEIKFILPNSGLKNFDEIYFATDGKDNELASVIPNNSDGSRWILNIDPKDVSVNGDYGYFYETILHEYFHYMTLNSSQVTYTYDYNMKNYCEEGMLSNKDSYVNEFYKEFWSEIIDDRNSDKDNFYFYERHKNRFVDEYASTDPSEDIAETFSYFILKDKPKGNSIKDQKIKFFYKYKELVKLRNELRDKISII